MARSRDKPLEMRMRLDGARETLSAFRSLPKDASDELRDRAQKLADWLAGQMRQNAESDESPQARLVAPTIRAKRDRVPVVTAGGTKRVGRRRVPVHQVLFGAEFGSCRFAQFGKRHRGPEGSFMFGTVDEHEDRINREWNEAADDVLRKFSAGDID